MTRPQLLAKYFVCYLQPVTKYWNLVAYCFRDLGFFADQELAGKMTHRQVRDILQARVKDAKKIIAEHQAGKTPTVCIGVADIPLEKLSSFLLTRQ